MDPVVSQTRSTKTRTQQNSLLLQTQVHSRTKVFVGDVNSLYELLVVLCERKMNKMKYNYCSCLAKYYVTLNLQLLFFARIIVFRWTNIVLVFYLVYVHSRSEYLQMAANWKYIRTVFWFCYSLGMWRVSSPFTTSILITLIAGWRYPKVNLCQSVFRNV